uniref:Death domain-containing protein n=1 Tax=Amphimedon queenslandica TaxID=400682 RepID=A0A1X7U8R0_AMPQE
MDPGKILGINDLVQVITTLEKNDFPEHRWAELGLKLNISQAKLDTVQADNPFNAKACLRGCLTIWLQQDYDVDTHGRPKLEKLAIAVKNMGLRAVADKIMENIISEGSSEKRKENDLPTVEADDVYEEFCELKYKFAHLVADIRGHLAKKVTHQELEIKEIARFMEHMIVEDIRLTDEVSIDPLFTRTKIHYSYHNCLLIKGIVNEYLKKSSWCICISYLVPRSAIADIINAVKSKSESMHRVGVFYISVDDDAILDNKNNVNFDESLLEAVKLGDIFEVSLLLSLGADPYYEDSNGDSPIMLSLLPENKGVAQLFLKLVSDTEDKISELISVDEKDDSEDMYESSCSKEKQMKIQEQSKAEEKLNARVLDKEKDNEGNFIAL